MKRLLLVGRLVDDLFELLEKLLFTRVVFGSDLVGAFERHVLEEMRDAGYPRLLVDTAHLYPGLADEHRRVVPGHEEHPQSVRECLFFHRGAERFQRASVRSSMRNAAGKKEEEQEKQMQWVHFHGG